MSLENGILKQFFKQILKQKFLQLNRHPAAEAESAPDDFLQRRGNDGDQEDDEDEKEEKERGNSGKLEVGGEAAERERHRREFILQSHHVRTFIHSWVLMSLYAK